MPDNKLTAPSGTNKARRQWRVGTFSMGTVLIVFGLILLLAQFNDYSAVRLVSTWWPAIMIVLGLEILAALYFSGEDKPTIKYDFFSILMVLLIGGVSFGMYAISTIGILPAIVETVSSRMHTVEVIEERFELKEDIKNIVVNAGGPNSSFFSICVQEADANEVLAFAKAAIPAQSQEAAEALVAGSLVNSHTVGDTLFIDLESLAGSSHFQQSPSVEHTIILPRGRSVQIDSDFGAPLQLKINDLTSRWAVNIPGRVNVSISRYANVRVEVFARRLGGESEWTLVNNRQNSGEENLLVKSSDGSLIFGETAEVRGQASCTYGSGSSELKINADEVYINEL